MKNESFYNQAQKLRDSYMESKNYRKTKVLCTIVNAYFEHSEEFPTVICLHSYMFNPKEPDSDAADVITEVCKEMHLYCKVMNSEKVYFIYGISNL